MNPVIFRSLMILFLIFMVWILIAQSSMTFRNSDHEMKKQFQSKGVLLETATASFQGRNIHYAKTSNDTLPTIIFFHGTPGSWDAFSRYMQDSELLQRFRMISIDRPGFGYSDFGKSENLQRQSELLSPLLHQFNNNKPIFLAGHSLGGPMIIKLAADNPDLFSALVIISGSEDPAEEKPEKWRPYLFNTPLNLLIPGAFRPSNVELWYLKKDLVKLQKDFIKVKCAVYFIHGDSDDWVPPENVAYAKNLLVNASQTKEIMIPKGNHFIPWTKYPEIKQVFLQLYGLSADNKQP